MSSVLYLLLFTGLLSPLFIRARLPGGGNWLALAPFIAFVYFALILPHITQGSTITELHPWIPSIHFIFSLQLDGLSLLFALLITGIGTLIVLYSNAYFNHHPLKGRFYLFLFLFMFSMLGCVLSDNLIQLVIFWELTSVTSYLLISFKHTELSARKAALQSLLVTAVGGLFLLLGSIIIYSVTHNWSIYNLITNPDVHLQKNHLYPIILICFLGAAFTKSAQYPFHFWLPNAMEAPTPVSAYLHSATMVKLGIYLIARMTPALGHTFAWQISLLSAGSVTMIVAGVLALRDTDLKRILADSTLMALGTMMFLLSDPRDASIKAAMIFLLTHALYKACLFLNAGIIDHTTHTRDIRYLEGLARKLPLTFITTILAASSLAGLPPVLGFVSKELVYEAQLVREHQFIPLGVAYITNTLFIVIALLLVIKPFLSRLKSSSLTLHHSENVPFTFAPIVLAVLCIVLGLIPNAIDNELIAPAVSSILNVPVSLELALWHGVTPALLISGTSVAVGIILFMSYRYIHQFLQHQSWIYYVKTESLYHLFLRSINTLSRGIMLSVQSGFLRYYVAIIFIFMSTMTGVTFLLFKHMPAEQILPLHAPWFGWFLSLLMILGGITLLLIRMYLGGLAVLGIIGLCNTLFFLLYSAPDVAMTQLLVDVLTIIIVVIALYRLPHLPHYQPLKNRSVVINLIISISVGACITTILLSIISTPFNDHITQFFKLYSLSKAHGRNVVNVILVDFRAYDTLGEMIVIAMSGLGVYALLKMEKKKKKKEAKEIAST